VYRRLRRGRKPQHSHEELLEIINDIWELQSEGKKYPLYVKGLVEEGDKDEEAATT